jgi:hypothetical protein
LREGLTFWDRICRARPPGWFDGRSNRWGNLTETPQDAGVLRRGGALRPQDWSSLRSPRPFHLEFESACSSHTLAAVAVVLVAQDGAPASGDSTGSLRPIRVRGGSIMTHLPVSFSPSRPPAMNKSTVLILLSALVATGPAAAQQEEGDVELELTGTLITSVGADEASGMGMMQAKVGRFVTDRWELGAFPSLEVRFGEGTTNTRIGAGLFATYSYLQPDAKTAPYVGPTYYRTHLL